MSILGRISAKVFAHAAYAVLTACRWKEGVVRANVRHVLRGRWKGEVWPKGSGELETGESHAIVGLKPHALYQKMMRNLTRHAGEMLFCLGTYKRLPGDCGAYPCQRDGRDFHIGANSAEVIRKMRRGGIFLTAHYGSYEASGAWLCALGVPLKASFVPLKPAWLNRYIQQKVRCVKRRPYSMDARTPREFLKLLDETSESGGDVPGNGSGDSPEGRQLFCLLADQDSRIRSAMDGNFLGCPAKINPLPDFLLRHRPDTPVFFCWIEERGCRKTLYAVEADLRRECQGDGCSERPGESVVDGVYRSWLEERIRKNPSLWYGWTHRRFFSKNPEIYGSSAKAGGIGDRLDERTLRYRR